MFPPRRSSPKKNAICDRDVCEMFAYKEYFHMNIAIFNHFLLADGAEGLERETQTKQNDRKTIKCSFCGSYHMSGIKTLDEFAMLQMNIK